MNGRYLTSSGVNCIFMAFPKRFSQYSRYLLPREVAFGTNIRSTSSSEQPTSHEEKHPDSSITLDMRSSAYIEGGIATFLLRRS